MDLTVLGALRTGLIERRSGVSVRPRRHARSPAVLAMDGAGWHKGDDLVIPGGIPLLHLPPHASVLNPVEIWRYLRRDKLAHRPPCYRARPSSMPAATRGMR